MPRGDVLDENKSPEEEKEQLPPEYPRTNGNKQAKEPHIAGNAEGPSAGGDGNAGAPPRRRAFALWGKPLPDPEKGRYSRAFQTALAGISCGVAVAALMVGYYVPWVLATCYIVAQAALMVPLSKRFFVSDLLAYAATVILAMLVGGFAGRWWEFMPFVIFFGLHPAVNCLQIKYRVNKWLALVITIVWFDGMLFIMYYALGGLMGLNDAEFWQAVDRYVWIIILAGGSLFLWLYDYLMFRLQIAINALVYRIKK